MRWFSTKQAAWFTFASFSKMSNTVARITDSSLWDKWIDWIPAIIEVYERGKGLTCKFDANGSRWNILIIVTDFDSTIEAVNLQNL